MRATNSIAAYGAAVWKCRYFWLSLVKNDLRARYHRSVLGLGWSLLNPVAMTAVLCTVFHRLWGLPISEYGPFVLSGLAFWGFVSTCTLQGCRCFYQAETYIRQYPAPLVIYPLRTALGAGFHLLIALVIVLAATWWFQGMHNVGVLWSLLPALLVLFVLGWSLAILAGVANVVFPDMQHLLEVGLQILFYATPILYKAEMLRERGQGWLVDFNPMATFLECLRHPLLEAQPPTPALLAQAGLWALLLAGTATIFLARLQKRVVFLL